MDDSPVEEEDQIVVPVVLVDLKITHVLHHKQVVWADGRLNNLLFLHLLTGFFSVVVEVHLLLLQAFHLPVEMEEEL